MHLGRFAKQHRHREINRLIAELAVRHREMMSFCGLTDDRVGQRSRSQMDSNRAN